MADGRHIENQFLAITRLHIVRLRRNLEFGGIIACARRLDDENVKFRKSNMAYGRHFENRYSSISQPRIVRIWRNLVRRRTVRHFWDIRLQKCRNLENRVKGPWRSLKMSPFDRDPMTSYWRSIVTMTLSHVVSEIFNVEKYRDLQIPFKSQPRSLKAVM